MSYLAYQNGAGKPDAVLGSGGMAFVATLPGGQAVRMEADGVNTTAQTITFTVPIKALSIRALPEAATTPNTNSLAVCIDPPNTAVRDAWLTAGSGASQRDLLKADGVQTLDYTFTDGNGQPASITTVGIKQDLGSDTLRVVLTGIKA